ncbi:hypothetical protein VNO77_20117 [Canavalia gladiata]|uniref:CASP-like protein n=1 Tax=Canavalia gladiata TaxID=3824 RepID=A0AAN9LNZ2_CANGL
MKKKESEEKATEEDSVSVNEKEDKDSEQKTKEETEHHSVLEPSTSLTLHSPSPSPSLRTRKSPSPPLHSLSDSPISDGHSSPPPQNPPPDSSPGSSISDGHFSISDQLFSPASPPVVMAHRFQVEPAVVTKVDPGAQEGFVGVKDVEQTAGSAGNRRLRPDISGLLRSKKIASWSKLLLAFRIIAFVFCLASFSVLATDKKRGWALDSFYFYKEFRYSLSVNVIGFVYSGLQICDLVLYLNNGKHIVKHQLWGYFTFALDQILTYLLMSASSSAATRAYDWESNWGADKFPYMANASVVLSFVAFVAFALASLVSGSIILAHFIQNGLGLGSVLSNRLLDQVVIDHILRVLELLGYNNSSRLEGLYIVKVKHRSIKSLPQAAYWIFCHEELARSTFHLYNLPPITG